MTAGDADNLNTVNHFIIDSGHSMGVWSLWLYVRAVERAIAAGQIPPAAKWADTWL